MKKVIAVILTCVMLSILVASCAVSRDSNCPSHDPNFFRKAYRR
ncbi:MAG TPA: hypothetical protein VHB48_10860 [Chitinophagaceae bacterium]|nr:hypothetical protein [Chitinophagaceae bacterium]